MFSWITGGVMRFRSSGTAGAAGGVSVVGCGLACGSILWVVN